MQKPEYHTRPSFRCSRGILDCRTSPPPGPANKCDFREEGTLFGSATQAFDRVWHEGLLYAINGILPPKLPKILAVYLSDRHFYVRHEGETSNIKPVCTELPYGVVLGATQYLLYVSDMPAFRRGTVAHLRTASQLWQAVQTISNLVQNTSPSQRLTRSTEDCSQQIRTKKTFTLNRTQDSVSISPW